MEYDFTTESYILQPNEVFEWGQVRVTNIGKTAQSVTKNLLSEFACLKLTTGPIVERGLEFRLRAGD